jgi:valyl-tRNA synthetase
LELSKPALFGDAPRPQVGEVLLTVLDWSLRLLHPVMPYLTEELWQRLPGHEAVHPTTICLAPYPEAHEAWLDPEVDAQMQIFIGLVTRARSLRQELNLAPKVPAHLHLQTADESLQDFFLEQAPLLCFLGRVQTVELGPAPDNSPRDLVAGVEMALVAEEQALDPAQRIRLEKEGAKLEEEILKARDRLEDPGFLGKAPPHVVESSRQRLLEMEERLERLRERL